MKAIVFDEHGDIDVLAYRDIESPELQPGEVRIAVRACSLNYHDVFTRRGMPGIKVPLPGIPGCDAAGQVAEQLYAEGAVPAVRAVDACDDNGVVGVGRCEVQSGLAYEAILFQGRPGSLP